jgi:hypothetical protein
MNTAQIHLTEILPSLQQREEWFDRLSRDAHPGGHLLRLGLTLAVLLFFYGVVMGANTGALQALTAGVKLPALFFLSFLICFPAFFIVQHILGSTMKVGQMATILVSGFILTAAILASFTPIIIFFILTGGDYHFMQLLHVAVFIVAGLFGMKAVLDALKFSCERKGIYPKTGVLVFRFWVIILAFVGIQLAWNLRPFLAQQDEPYALFRKYEGNFYTAVLYSVSKLTESPAAPTVPHGGRVYLAPDSAGAK